MITDCIPSFFKYFLSALNLVFFFISGIALFIGIWITIDKNTFISFVELSVNNSHVQVSSNIKEIIHDINQPKALDQLGHVLLYAGGSVCFVSSMGYFGASKESRFLLVIYALCMIILVLVETFIVGVTAAYRREVVIEIKRFFRYALHNFYSGAERSSDAVTMTLNYLMAEMKCCGVDNYTDFRRSKVFHEKKEHHHQILPSACCILNPEKYPPYFVPEDTNCLAAPTSYNSYFLKGCWNRFVQWINAVFNPLIFSVASLLFLEMSVILISCCLCRAVEKDLRQK